MYKRDWKGNWYYDEDHVPNAHFKAGRSAYDVVEGIYIDHSQSKTHYIIGEGCKMTRKCRVD